MRSDYKICPLCGAVLDIGEQCDCMEQGPGDYKGPLDINTPGHHIATRKPPGTQEQEQKKKQSIIAGIR